MRAVAWQNGTLRDLSSWAEVQAASGPTWVDLPMAEDQELIRAKQALGIPPLALEEHGEDRHRALVREGPEGTLALAMPYAREEGEQSDKVEASLELVWGKNFLLTLHRAPASFLEEVWKRLHTQPMWDHLGMAIPLYLLLDEAVEEIFPKLDMIQEKIFHLEGRLTQGGNHDFLQELFTVRRRVMQLRRLVSGQHRVFARLLSDTYRSRFSELHPYLEDAHDHLTLSLETLDSFHEVLGSTVEAYMSSASNRLNQIMKTLTILATLMMPLTLITGIYGMNFQIPEVHWRYGYYYSLGLMASIVGMMLLYFRSRRWI